MKLFFVILSISLAYCSNADFLDQYIDANHQAELTRTLSPEFLHGQLAEVKALVEVAKTKRIAAEHWDMADSLALAGTDTARAIVQERHDNKRFSQIEAFFIEQQRILDRQTNVIESGDLLTAWRAILKVKVVADSIIKTNQ